MSNEITHFNYLFFGNRIRSEIQLHGATHQIEPASNHPVDIDVYFHQEDQYADLIWQQEERLALENTSLWVSACGYSRWRFYDASETMQFVISSDYSRVWITMHGQLDNSNLLDAAAIFQGIIMGYILRKKGFLCLHAAVVEHKGKVFAVMGKSGAGKSTLAAQFYQRSDCRVLADDIAAIESTPAGLVLRPGNLKIRLTQECVTNLHVNPQHCKAVSPYIDKMYVSATPVDKNSNRRYDTEHSELITLDALYELSYANRVDGFPIDKVNPVNALVLLSQQIYPPSMFRMTTQAEIAQCVILLKKCQYFRFERAKDLGSLATSAEDLLKHVNNIEIFNN